MKVTILILFATLMLSGCVIDDFSEKMGYEKKTKYEGLIAQTKREYEQKLLEKENEIDKRTGDFIKGLENKMSFAADRLYGADFAHQLDSEKDRIDFIINNRVNEARNVLPSPSLEAMLKENETVRAELDETRTSLEELKKNHLIKMDEAKKLNEEVVRIEHELQTAKIERENLEKEKNIEIDDLQEKLNDAKNEIIAREKARSDDAKAIQAAKMKLSIGAGILAALALAGAIWSPVWKDKLGLIAGILAIAAVGIWYIEGWMILAAIGIGLAFIILRSALQYNKEHKASTNTYRAIQSFKDENPKLYENLKPYLIEWNKKYGKNNEKLDDDTIIKHIDNRLKEVEAK